MSTRAFDLNIEEVLENWDVEHAIREIIANALDEQLLSNTADIKINKDLRGHWHIRDFGRGLRIEHFTQNEDAEKLNSRLPIIGKFGVGLKDALATLHRRSAQVVIQSQFGTFRLREASKHGFESIVTLHIEYDDTPRDTVGTEFILGGVSDSQVAKAKSLFVRFAGERIIEATSYGEILARQPDQAKVYILGVLASEEPNFLFSYNVTSLTDGMKKRLNRERLNVGRTTYSDRVKAILRNCTAPEVHDRLVEQVTRRAAGDQADEMAWIEISQFALNLMHQRGRVAYVTEEELQARPDIVGSAKSDGLKVVVITEQQKERVEAQALSGGPELRTLDVYAREFNASFQYEFIEPDNLTKAEKAVFDLTPRILALVMQPVTQLPSVKISRTMRVTSTDAQGVWDSAIASIVIKRDCLVSLPRYAGTLLHETAHAIFGVADVTTAFELALTGYLGTLASIALTR